MSLGTLPRLVLLIAVGATVYALLARREVAWWWREMASRSSNHSSIIP
jgi:hypothetical protein